jgi:predicted lipid-binding transport protein (Tim44 family)
MMSFGKTRIVAMLATLAVAFMLVSTDFADARRGGSFGSRGVKTFQSAPPTRTAPNTTGPVERSMTPNTGPTAATRQPGVTQQRPGFFNGLGGSLMGGLLLGGLFGMLLGYGFGGFAGALGFVLQLLLIGALVMLALRFFRSQPKPATAGGPRAASVGSSNDFGRGETRREGPDERPAGNGRAGSFTVPNFGGAAAPAAAAAAQDIELSQTDLDAFERLLGDVQRAFADEDHAALRRLSTPEIVSYLSEELAENAKNGVRNDVSNVHLAQADIAEAWREGDRDYATAAFQYESVDIFRDRATGKVVKGDETEPTETTELWTFTRRSGEDWKLSAIQEAA